MPLYNPTPDTLATDTEVATAVTNHEGAADPHTGYLKENDFDDVDFLVGTATGLTAAEIVVGTTPGGELGNTWASPTVDATHSGSTHAATQAAAEATAAGALTTHEGAADPHTGYVKENDANWTDLTDNGATTLHTHAGGGAPTGVDYLVGTADGTLSAEIVVGTTPGGELGGTWASPTVDATHSGSTHGAAVTTHEGAADPHTGYRLESADHSHASTGLQGGTIAHSATTGQTANDHHAQAHAIDGADHTAAGLTAGHVVRATAATTFAFGALQDGDIPATIARDAEVTTAVSDHAAAADPHAVYLKETDFDDVDFLVGTATAHTAAEIVVGTTPGGELGGTWASPTVDATHSGSTHGAAVTTHEGLADPHTGYRLESADHSHATTGLQAGTVAHSALTGLTTGDPHTQYLQEADANWVDLTDGGATTLHSHAGSDPSIQYAPGSITVATGFGRPAIKNLTFTTTQRLTIQGTGRLSVYN